MSEFRERFEVYFRDGNREVVDADFASFEKGWVSFFRYGKETFEEVGQVFLLSAFPTDVVRYVQRMEP